MIDYYMREYVSALTSSDERRAMQNLMYELIREIKLLRLDVDELRKLHKEELKINA